MTPPPLSAEETYCRSSLAMVRAAGDDYNPVAELAERAGDMPAGDPRVRLAGQTKDRDRDLELEFRGVASAYRDLTADDLARLAVQIKNWGRELGFQQVGIADIDLAADEAAAGRPGWPRGRHGEMDVHGPAWHAAQPGPRNWFPAPCV
jgi:hypothetical protein